MPKSFFRRPSPAVAKDLLGKVLVRKTKNEIISGRITETEAYLPVGDLASHAVRGRTKATNSLYLDPGHLYIHRIHRQDCLDIVTGKKGVPMSVLIRGLDTVKGPGRLTKLLEITCEMDGLDIVGSVSPVYVADDGFKPKKIITTKRIGITKSTNLDLRFVLIE